MLSRSHKNSYPLPLNDATDLLLTPRSYIYDHRLAMDICRHPNNMKLHGFTSSAGTDAGSLVPLFTFAKTNIHSDILVPPLEQYSETYDGFDPPFSEKGINKLLWRGSTTGAEFSKGVDWKSSQRSRLHFLGREANGTRNVLLSNEAEAAREVVIPISRMNSAYLDLSFSGHPAQCDKETCKVMKDLIEFADTMGLDEAYQVSHFCNRRKVVM